MMQCLLIIPVGIVIFLLCLETLSYILYEYCIELSYGLQSYSIYENMLPVWRDRVRR